MKKVVLFIGGNQGAGKTTAAKYIREYFHKLTQDTLLFGAEVFIYKYADPLYRLHDEVEKFFHKLGAIESVRPKYGPLLQRLGNEIGRELYGENVWVNNLVDRISASAGGGLPQIHIVEDVRRKNELDWPAQRFKDLGYKVISVFLDAPEDVRKTRTDMWRPDTSHKSESELQEFRHLFDYTISTTSGPENDLRPLIDSLRRTISELTSPEEIERILKKAMDGVAAVNEANNQFQAMRFPYRLDVSWTASRETGWVTNYFVRAVPTERPEGEEIDALKAKAVAMEPYFRKLLAEAETTNE